jgi:hypothetical protein
METDGVGETCL